MPLTAARPFLLRSGNVRLADLTRDGVRIEVADGIVREDRLNEWFARHVPRTPWRDPTAAERSRLRDPGDGASTSTLYALDLPEALRAGFWDRYAQGILSAAADGARRGALEEFRDFLLGTLAPLSLLAVNEVRTFDLMLSPPDSPSTAFDPRSGKFVGLHVDDHEGLGFTGRSRGFQLLSVNLGSAPRHFQFVNHDIKSLLGYIGGESALPEGARSAASVVQAVFRRFPGCQVARMTLNPCQGYIAVTQDLIHDGATNRLGRPDVSCLLAGRFDLRGGDA